MQPGPNDHALHCTRCGSPLEAPADLNAVHADCPYCGLDNVLPDYLIQLRRQRVLELQHREAVAQAQAFQARARAERSRSTTAALVVVAIIFMAIFGSIFAYYVFTDGNWQDSAK